MSAAFFRLRPVPLAQHGAAMPDVSPPDPTLRRSAPFRSQKKASPKAGCRIPGGYPGKDGNDGGIARSKTVGESNLLQQAQSSTPPTNDMPGLELGRCMFSIMSAEGAILTC